MGREVTSARAAALVAQLQEAATRLLALLERVDDTHWGRVPAPDVWCIGKDADHVAEATGYHQWIVRLTIGEKVGSRRPVLERKQMTSDRTRDELLVLIRDRTAEGVSLIAGLSDQQLDLPTKPPRANGQRLAETIERVLIGHYGVHRMDIEAKLMAQDR